MKCGRCGDAVWVSSRASNIGGSCDECDETSCNDCAVDMGHPHLLFQFCSEECRAKYCKECPRCGMWAERRPCGFCAEKNPKTFYCPNNECSGDVYFCSQVCEDADDVRDALLHQR